MQMIYSHSESGRVRLKRKVKRIILTSAVGMLFLYGWSAQAASIFEPLNPQVQAHSLYLSSQGVSRYNLDTGALQWNALQTLHTFEPVVTEQIVLVGSTTGLYALDKKTGKERWRHAGATRFSPVVVDNTVYVGARSGELTALSLKDGQVQWHRQFDGWIYVTANETGQIFVGGQGHTLTALDAENGQTIWQQALSNELVYRPVSLRNGQIAVTTFDGQATVFDRDGQKQWQQTLGVVAHPPLQHEDQLLLLGFDGSVRSLEVKTGELNWLREFGAGQWLITAASRQSQQLMLSNDEGEVYLLGARTGDTTWHGRVGAQPLISPVRYAEQLAFPVASGVDRAAKLRLEPLPIH